MKRTRLLLISIFLINTGLWAGGSQDTPATEISSSAEDSAITIVDALNREITLPAIPERIVQAGSSAFIVNHALFLFPEAKKRVIAMADSNQGRGYFLPQVDSSYDEKMILSRRINMEEVLAAKPDLVVMKDFLFSRYDQEFANLGIPVVYLNLESPEGWKSDLETLGALFGNPHKAAELQQMFDQRIQSVQDAVSAVPKQENNRVLILDYSEKDGVSAFQVPPLTFIQTTMLKMAGGEPVWKDADLGERWTTVSFEQIAAWDPDLIFLISYRTPYDQVFELMESSGYWNELDAYRNGEVYPFPMDYHSWDQPDPRWLLGLQWMAKILNYDAFPQLDMEEEAGKFFSDFYGISGETFQTGIKPVMEGLN